MAWMDCHLPLFHASMESMAASRRIPVMSWLLAASLATIPPSWAAWPDPVDSPSEAMPRAQRSLMLDVAALPGGRLIAVGERGHVLVSEDDGASWRQITTPVRSTLTAVAAAGGTVVAAGHDGVILHSTDAGETWRRVREERWSADNQMSPSNGSPLLDVLFLDGQRVLAVGAYAMVLRSNDGGATWEPVEADLAGAAGQTGDAAGADGVHDGDEDGDSLLFHADELEVGEEVDPHLNAITRVGDLLLMVGERGSLFRSRDDGETWERLPFPYGGSMFGLLPLGGDSVLAYGLRGRAYQSDDAGTTWTEVDTGTTASLFGGDAGAGGEVVLVGAQGVVLRRNRGDGSFRQRVYTTEEGETPTGSAVRLRADGSLLLVGDRGITTWQEQP